MLQRVLALFLWVGAHSLHSAPDETRPNIVYLMSDELAYFELGHMGNPYLKTPRIDQFAKEGIRFTHAYAASPVCGPLRGQMLTGKHAGHASVRSNDGGTALRAEEITIGNLLKDRGYATGGFGKWGAGGRGSTGVPEKHGFDLFVGYYDQVHAHSFFPEYIIRNSEELPLAGNEGGRSGATYSHHVIMDEAVKWIREHKDEPFFCYLPFTPPHGMYDIPADDPAWRHYQGAEWMKDKAVSSDIRNYAAMVSMIDDNLGTVLDLLKELGLDDNTVVFFTGDNGGHDRFRNAEHPRGFYGPNKNPRTGVEFRGGKGNLYEGGLRIPYLVRWPEKIAPGQIDSTLISQVDVMATLSDISGAEVPDDTDGISFKPTLLGKADKQKKHDFLYWEFGSQFAVRQGDWKLIQPKKDGAFELYKISEDISEENDLAADHKKLVAELRAIITREHEPARPGSYEDPKRVLHERDRAAKWGKHAPAPKPKKPKANQWPKKGMIPQDTIKLHAFSSENTNNGKHARNAIDGDPSTVWHSKWDGPVAKHPHQLIIDLGKEREVQGIRYLARQDGGNNGNIKGIEVGAGNDPENLPTVVEKELTDTKDPQAVEWKEPVRVRYVRITATSEVADRAFASAAEIGVIGK